MQEGVYHDDFEGHQHPLEKENKALRARVAKLEKALKELLDYTRACEGLLNVSECGACVKARRVLEGK